jgi:hypothetical protein
MTLRKTLVLVLALVPIGLGPAQSSTIETLLAMPLAYQSHQDVVNQYLAPMTEYGQGHRGIDLPALMGDQVLSPATGQISFVGKVGYRNLISIQFGNSFTASLEPVCSDLAEGMNVQLGDPIGLVCEPDPEYVWHCQQTCLHFGTRSESGYFSPLAIIGGLTPSRLAYYARG